MCTSDYQPDDDNWGNLKQLLKYIRGTIFMSLVLESNKLRIVSWWMCFSFAVHPDCKSHTGLMMSLCKEAASSVSRKQRINTKISIESEIVGVDVASPQIL